MKTFDDLFAEYFRNVALLDAARKYQPAAMLLQSTRPRGLLYRHPISLDTSYAPVPTAVISREHAERLARLAEKGDVRVRLSITNKTLPAYQSKNVNRGNSRPRKAGRDRARLARISIPGIWGRARRITASTRQW